MAKTVGYSNKAVEQLKSLANSAYADIETAKSMGASWYAVLLVAIHKAAEIGAENPRHKGDTCAGDSITTVTGGSSATVTGVLSNLEGKT